MVAHGPYSSRPWTSRDDTRAMQEVASARLAADWPAVRFHPGDIDWWVVLADERTRPLTERVRLWIGPDGEPVGYAWFSPPADLDFLVAALEGGAAEAVIGEMLAWAENCRVVIGGDIEPLRVWLAAEDRDALGSVQAAGFRPEERPGYVHFTGDLSIIDDRTMPALDPSLRIRPLRTEADIAARVACGRAAFPRSTMTAQHYRRVEDAWLYRPELDLQVVTDQDVVAAFALGWLDPLTGTVELEPVGVHPDWQRRGLGGEICRAVLRAARDSAATRVMIAAERTNDAALGLYSSLGLEITSEIVAFKRAATAIDDAEH